MGSDSPAELEALLADAEGVPRVDLLIRLGTALVETDPDRSRELFVEALELAGSGGDEGEGQALFGLGESARVSGDYSGAIERYSAALKLAEQREDRLLHGRCLRRLGDMHYFLTNLDLALRYYLRALRIFEEAGHTGDMPDTRLQSGHLLSAIGNVLKRSGDLDGAMDYYRRSLEVYRLLGYTAGMPGVTHNIANVMQERGRLEEAEAAYRESLEDALRREDVYLASLVRNSLGSVYLAWGDYGKAEEQFLASLEISRGMNRRRGILVSLLKLQELHRVRGEYDSALEVSEQAEMLARELGDAGVLGEILREKAAAFALKGEHCLAYDCLRGFLEIEREQMSEKRVRQIDVLRLYYETEERDREIRRLNLTNRKLTRAWSEAEELTRTDALTGLANRRAAQEWLADQQEMYESTGTGYGLILADVDRFKSCNDRFGHDAGDAVLVQLAGRLRGALRKEDLAVRWGGEEFLVLLRGVDLQDAARVAESLRTLVESEPFDSGGTRVRVTLTLGVSPGGCLPVETVIRGADQAMYRGKHLGRNRVEIAPVQA